MQANYLDDIAIIYITTIINRERIDSCPPQLPFTIENDNTRKEYMDNAKHGAGQYDMYKDVVQLSMLVHRPNLFDRFYHIIFCDDPNRPVGHVDSGNRLVEFVDKESTLIIGAVNTLRNLAGMDSEGLYRLPQNAVPVLAGWKLFSDIWPLIVTKSVAYNAPLPQFWRMSPVDRFSNVRGLLEISNIYTQGVSMNMRKLPALSDALRYFGIGKEYDEPLDIAETICTKPEAVVDKVERYLLGQYELLKRYNA